MWREKDPIAAEGITRHALRKVNSPAKPPAEDDMPRGSAELWIALGAIVYSWSDRRSPATDRAWWIEAGGRLSAAKQPPGEAAASVREHDDAGAEALLLRTYAVPQAGTVTHVSLMDGALLR